MKLIVSKYLTGSVVSLLLVTLTACINSDSDSSASNSSTGANDLRIAAESVEEIPISAAGIKGPLAFADAKLYAFDPSFSEFYDKNAPISSAISDQFAKIDGLAAPRDIEPPYILTVGGDNAIDLNSGTAPVIATLVTVITEGMLAGDHTVYATPLTTMVFHMARHGSSATVDASSFIQQVRDASSLVSLTFAVSEDIDIDVLKSPLLINDTTVTPAEQEEAVHHRAAVEAFAAKVYELSSSLDNVTTDSLIERLGRDLQSDGVIDNLADGTAIGGIDPAILNQDSMQLPIPNTPYRVEDIVTIMEEERSLIMTDRGPTFQVAAIEFGTQRVSRPDTPAVSEFAPVVTPGPVVTRESVVTPEPVVAPNPVITLTSFPVELLGDAPEAASITINVSKPADVANGFVTLTTYDADHSNEGELIINKNMPVPLFGASGVSGNNNNAADIVIRTPASYWNDGENTLRFKHNSGGGFIIDAVSVSFEPEASDPLIEPDPTDIMGKPDVFTHVLPITQPTGPLIESGPIVISGKNDVVISGMRITNPNGSCIKIINGASNIIIENSEIGPCSEKGIDIVRSRFITIKGNYIHDTVDEGIMSHYKASDIVIDSNVIENVQSGYEGWGTKVGNLVFTNNFVKNVQRGNKNGGNVVQLAFVHGGGIRITDNIAINILGQSNPEDLINVYSSDGTADDPIQIMRNKFNGGGPRLSSGGIILGDQGGSYQVAEDNILVNPGQYGLQIGGGDHHTFRNNLVYTDDQRSFTNVGVIIWRYGSGTAPGECYSLTVALNEITWWRGPNYKNKGNDPWLAPHYKPSFGSDKIAPNCGDVAGWNTNKFDTRDSQPANLDISIWNPAWNTP